MITGEEPFYGRSASTIKYNNKNVNYEFDSVLWRNISMEAKDWIARALRKNPKQRFTPDEALRHCWLCDNIQQPL